MLKTHGFSKTFSFVCWRCWKRLRDGGTFQHRESAAPNLLMLTPTNLGDREDRALRLKYQREKSFLAWPVFSISETGVAETFRWKYPPQKIVFSDLAARANLFFKKVFFKKSFFFARASKGLGVYTISSWRSAIICKLLFVQRITSWLPEPSGLYHE